MTDDRIEGTVKNGIGRVEDAFGGLTGDEKTQAKGKLNQAAGQVQNVVGQVKDQAQDALDQARAKAQDAYGDLETYVRDKPGASVGVALAAGLVLGLLLRGGTRTVYVAGRP